MYSYGLHKLVSVGGLCGLVPACSLLRKASKRRGSADFILAYIAWAAIKSNHTQTKWVGPTSRQPVTAWRKPPLLTLMLNRFKSADLEASDPTWNGRRYLSQATLGQRKSFKGSKSSGSAKPWGISVPLLQSVGAHSCLVPSESKKAELQAGTRLKAINRNWASFSP